MIRLCILLVSMAMLAGCATGGRVGAAPAPGSAVGTAQMTRVAERLREGGDTAAATTVYRAARRQDARDPAVLLGLADSLRQTGEYQEAAATYEELLRVQPRHVEAMRGLAGALIALNEPSRARELLLVAVAADGSDPRLYSALGVANDRLGEHETAQAWYRAGLRVRPGDATLQHNLALSLILSGQEDEGLEMMRRVAAAPAASAANRRGLALAEAMIRDRASLVAVAPARPAPVAAVAVTAVPPPTSDSGTPAPQDRAHVADGALSWPQTVAASAKEAADTAPLAAANVLVAPVATTETEPARPKLAAGESRPLPIPRERPRGGPPGIAVAAALPGAGVLESDAALAFAALAPAAGGDPGGFQVQLGALDSEDNAVRLWRSAARKLPQLFELLSPHIQQATAAGGGTVFRLRTEPLPSRDDAERLCAALKHERLSCFIIRSGAPRPEAASPPPGVPPGKSA